MIPEVFSISDAAMVLNVHPNTITQWVKRGCPYVKVEGGKTNSKYLKLGDVMEWRISTTIDEMSKTSGGEMTLEAAKRRKLAAEAEIKEAEAAIKKAEAISVEEVYEAVLSEYTRVKSKLRQISKKVAPLLEGLDVDEIEEIIRKDIDTALEELIADETYNEKALASSEARLEATTKD